MQPEEIVEEVTSSGLRGRGGAGFPTGIKWRTVLDNVLLRGRAVAADERPFVIAVNCGQAGNTCFCVSMETGPRAKAGYDLALTELLEG